MTAPQLLELTGGLDGAATAARFDSGLAGSYIPGMPSKRVPTPKDTIKIRRRKAKAGDTIQLTGTVTKVQDNDNPLLSRITLRIPGYAIPITLSEHTLLGGGDD